MREMLTFSQRGNKVNKIRFEEGDESTKFALIKSEGAFIKVNKYI